MKLEDVVAFLRVAEFRSFSQAAYSLCLSKSIISGRVSRLERDLEVKLLARTTRGVSLTEGGEIFRARSLVAIEELNAAQDALRGTMGGLSGKLRFTATLHFGIKCVANVLPKFLELHPNLRCDADYSYEALDLKSGRFDVALRLCRPRDYLPNLQLVARIENYVVGSPELLARVGAPKHPMDLRTKPCVTYYGVADVDHWHFDIGNRTIGVAVKGVMRTNSMEALKLAAEGGVGFAKTPLFSVVDSLKSGALVRVLPDYISGDLLVCAEYPPGVNVSPVACQFVEFLKNNLGAPTTLD